MHINTAVTLKASYSKTLTCFYLGFEYRNLLAVEYFHSVALALLLKYLNASFTTEDDTSKLNLERLYHLTILNEEFQSKPQSNDI